MANWAPHHGPAVSITPAQLIPTSSLKAITVNLQSGIGKLHFIEQQLVEQEIQIACMQEMKGRASAIRSQAYLRFESESESVWGCAIWISKLLPLARLGGRDFFIEERDVAVVTAKPRMLVLKLRTPASWIFLASMHRPAQTRPVEERTAFTADLEAVLEAAGGFPCIIGMDANGRVPADMDLVTGDLQCGEADQSGLDLVQLLSAYGFWMPSTFSACHDGAMETWTHPGGKRSRIDFPVLSRHFDAQCVQTWAAVELDTLNSNDDHDAVGISVTLVQPCQCGKPPQLDRGKKYDPRKLRDPAVMSRIDEWIEVFGLKDIPWELDVNAHAQAVQEALYAIMCKEAPLTAKGPRSSYIPEDAWRVRDRRQRGKQLTRQRKSYGLLEALRAPLQVWSMTGRGYGGDLLVSKVMFAL